MKVQLALELDVEQPARLRTLHPGQFAMKQRGPEGNGSWSSFCRFRPSGALLFATLASRFGVWAVRACDAPVL